MGVSVGVSVGVCVRGEGLVLGYMLQWLTYVFANKCISSEVKGVVAKHTINIEHHAHSILK